MPHRGVSWGRVLAGTLPTAAAFPGRGARRNGGVEPTTKPKIAYQTKTLTVLSNLLPSSTLIHPGSRTRNAPIVLLGMDAFDGGPSTERE